MLQEKMFFFVCNFGSSYEPEQQVYRGMSAGCIGKAVHLLNHQLLWLKTRQSVVEKSSSSNEDGVCQRH